MRGIGDNNGPTMEPGAGWRRYAWGRARRELLPRLPLEVVRLRIRRARELGIDYKAYASIRAGTGRDIVALLFSSNALRVGPRLVVVPADRAGRLAAMRGCSRLAFLHAPLPVADFLRQNPEFDAADRAPGLAQSWAETGARVTALTAARGLPGPGVVLVGETGLERDWAVAGKLGGYLDSARVFSGSNSN